MLQSHERGSNLRFKSIELLTIKVAGHAPVVKPRKPPLQKLNVFSQWPIHNSVTKRGGNIGRA
jgi:hypothetical protein